MASTFSPILRIELIGTGDQSGTWGNTTNVNLGTLIEQAIAGTATINVSSGNVTLTNFNGTSDQARCMALRVTGTPSTSRNIVAPAVSKFYIIANGSNAAVVLKTSVSTGLTVPVGEVYLAYYDTTSNDFRLVGRASASTNTANTLVLRDGSGNFAAGVITATGFTGPIGVGTPAAALFTTMSTSGNTIIGDASADTLTVNATPTFNVAIPVTSGGTGVTTSTGTGSVVRATSPTLVTPALGTPSSGVLTNTTGLPIVNGTTGTLSVARGGTGVTTSTGTGSTVLSTSPTLTSPTLVTPLLGTPTSGTLTNCTGLPIVNGTTGTLSVARGGTGVTTSTGSGANVLATSPTLTSPTLTSPTLVTPVLGTPTSGTLTNCTGLPIVNGTTGTLSVARGGTGVTTSTGTGSVVLSNSPNITSLGVGTAASGVSGEIRASNNITAFFSDKRLKENIIPIPNALQKVMAITGVTYNVNNLAASFGYDKSKSQVGVIAQEIEAVLPEIVVPAPFDIQINDDGTESSRSGEHYKTVQYDKLIPLLIEAIKEQQQQVIGLQSTIRELLSNKTGDK